MALFFLLGIVPGRGNNELHVAHLRCDHLENPAGIDDRAPALSWWVSSDRRGEQESAFRVLVASSQELLAQGRGDIWDSGRKVWDQSAQVVYGGKALASREACFWKVMVWDQAGEASGWSETAQWSMGLLGAKDWKAEWISDATLSDPMKRPLRPIHCYLSRLASRADVAKWIALDLGAARTMDTVNLVPARPLKLNPDFRTVLFPARFKIEVADDPSYSKARVVVDESTEDFEAPRGNNCLLHFPPVSARYVRVLITKLAHWDGSDYGVALGGLAATDGGKLVSGNALVSCADSMETQEYSKSWLTQAKQPVTFAPDAVAASFPGVKAAHMVSRVALLRRDFRLDGVVKRATLYVTARGFYDFYLNGKKVGDELLDPGYSDYWKRIAYQSYDVTDLLRPGQNAMGAMLGYGWYAGHMNMFSLRCIDGFYPQLLAQLEVEMADGRHVVVASDGQWRTTLSGPVRWSDLLDGEGYDTRMEMPGWNEAGFDDRAWTPAWSQAMDGVALVSPHCQPVRQIAVIKPVLMRQPKPGVFVYDLGQEITGYCRITMNGPAGTVVKVRHAEMSYPDGMINVKNLWGTPAEEDYILDGKSARAFEPHFTYHGFRYVEVTGLTQPPEKLAGVDIHTDVPAAGEFSCSNALYNRMMNSARWTQWNLLFNVPAGCAGRCERLAWLGDIRPCVQTTMFNMDMAAFYGKYATDIRDEQTADGRYCDITPHDAQRGTNVCTGSPGWADAGVSLPWQAYVNDGDRRALEEHYESAKQWVDFVHGRNPGLLWTQARGNDWGDWLSAGRPSTPKELGATAFFAHSADLVSKMAHALGREKEAAAYGQLFEGIRAAFIRAYGAADGKIGNDSQGCYALALDFKLLDEPARSQAVSRLLDSIHRAAEHPATGFWSSSEMLMTLSENGENAEATRMLNVRTAPSWGFMADNGTTFWESFNAVASNLSLNHWTHSAVGEWLWRNVAGINPDPAHPGYQSFIIRPRPSEAVQSCEASYDSVRGPIKVAWAVKSGVFTLDLAVPVNSTAEVYLPVTNPVSVRENGKPAAESTGVKLLRMENGSAVYQVASGSYHFTAS